MAQRTRRYLIRRVTVVLLTLFVVTLLSFLLMRLSPVDPATAYVKRNSAVVTQEQIDEARVILGLDKPLPVQYFDWVVDALHMDFGISLGTGNPVTEELAKTVPVTLTVVAYSAVIMSLGVLGVGMLGYLWRQKAGGMILSLYYRVVVIKAPLQGLCYTVRDAVDWCFSPTTRMVSERFQPQPLTLLLIS